MLYYLVKGGEIMKKILFSFLLLCATISLCSCKVNWFTGTIDVPWYFVVIPIILVFIAAYAILMSQTYVCPDCNTEINPKWYQLSVCIHFGGKRVVKCPNCGRRGFCKTKK